MVIYIHYTYFDQCYEYVKIMKVQPNQSKVLSQILDHMDVLSAMAFCISVIVNFMLVATSFI